MPFTSETTQLEGDAPAVRGRLESAGNSLPLDLHATVTVIDGGPVIEAETTVNPEGSGHDLEPPGHKRYDQHVLVKGNPLREGP
jgi:polyisoprenoid-binding protein YceI